MSEPGLAAVLALSVIALAATKRKIIAAFFSAQSGCGQPPTTSPRQPASMCSDYERHVACQEYCDMMQQLE